MDTQSLLDTLHAQYVTGALGSRSLAVLAEAEQSTPADLICSLLRDAPKRRRWLPAMAARWAPERHVSRALQQVAFDGAGPTPARRAALESLFRLQPERARRDALDIMSDTREPGDLRAAAAELLARNADDGVRERVATLAEGASEGTRRLATWILEELPELEPRPQRPAVGARDD